MKAQIEEIFLRLYENVQHGVEWDHAKNELELLMCYREVRAYYLSYWHTGSGCIPENYLDLECINILAVSYSEEIIMKAIEQVKSEQK